jgi:hypothetical protein
MARSVSREQIESPEKRLSRLQRGILGDLLAAYQSAEEYALAFTPELAKANVTKGKPHQRELQLLSDYGVRWWSRGRTRSECAASSRALARLQRRGLVVRFGGSGGGMWPEPKLAGNPTIYVKLTALGRAVTLAQTAALSPDAQGRRTRKLKPIRSEPNEPTSRQGLC